MVPAPAERSPTFQQPRRLADRRGRYQQVDVELLLDQRITPGKRAKRQPLDEQVGQGSPAEGAVDAPAFERHFEPVSGDAARGFADRVARQGDDPGAAQRLPTRPSPGDARERGEPSSIRGAEPRRKHGQVAVAEPGRQQSASRASIGSMRQSLAAARWKETPARLLQPAAGMKRVRLFGLTIASELPLPGLVPAPENASVDVTICRRGAWYESGSRHQRRWIVRSRWRARDHRRRLAGVPERNIRLFLLGSVMGLLLHQRGLFRSTRMPSRSMGERSQSRRFRSGQIDPRRLVLPPRPRSRRR
jgi:hypothetical protein